MSAVTTLEGRSHPLLLERALPAAARGACATLSRREGGQPHEQKSALLGLPLLGEPVRWTQCACGLDTRGCVEPVCVLPGLEWVTAPSAGENSIQNGQQGRQPAVGLVGGTTQSGSHRNPHTYKLGVVVHTCNASIWRRGLQGQPWLHVTPKV